MVGLRDPGPRDHEDPLTAAFSLHPHCTEPGSWAGPHCPSGHWSTCCPLWAVSHSSSALSLSQAKLGDEILDYRDLAALPKSKAIYNIDRPDMISYSPYISHSATGRQSCHEVRPPWQAVCPRQGLRLLPPLLPLGLLSPLMACAHPLSRGPKGSTPTLAEGLLGQGRK